MELKDETISFFMFILLGILVGIIFDFFRAIRKVKKYKEKYIYLQDIIFFLVVGIVLASVLIYKLEEELRLYLFLSLFLGVVIYISTISMLIIKIFISIIKISDEIVKFIFLPLTLYKYIFVTIYVFLTKKCKKCCNNFHNMISYFYKPIVNKIHKIK